MGGRWPVSRLVTVLLDMDKLPKPDRFFRDWTRRLMTDEYATLRLAYGVGATIQAWHLNEGATTSNDGRWDDLSTLRAPQFDCPVHLYRVKPESES